MVKSPFGNELLDFSLDVVQNLFCTKSRSKAKEFFMLRDLNPLDVVLTEPVNYKKALMVFQLLPSSWW